MIDICLMEANFIHSEVTERVIKAFYTVYNKLGYGFLEKVYTNALMLEFTNQNLEFQHGYHIEVYYNHCKVGFFIADIVVNGCVIVEVKAVQSILKEHEAQLVNYLKATDIEVGLLLNFGKTPQFVRRVFSNEYRKSLKNHTS